VDALSAWIVGTYLGLWLFFIYGFAGVLLEMLYCWTIEFKGVFESRTALLYLPINPLYGIGGVVISLVLLPVFDNPIVVFFLGALVGTILEYIASVVMEKAFHAVYWDYSKEFLNFQGRVCLKYAVLWGLLSLVLLYVFDVFNIHVLAQVPPAIGLPVLGFLVLITVLSIILTLMTFRRVRQRNTYLAAKKAGEPAELPNPGWARLVDKLVPDAVLVNTFPRMSLVTQYQELSGHHRKVWFWMPSIGSSTAARQEAAQRAVAQATQPGGANQVKTA
jgi:uncharacterized membrane protein